MANPARLVDGELPGLLRGVDVAVVRILGGYRLGRTASTPCWPAGFPPFWSAENSRRTPT
ncbi:putative cobaltochelatase CobN subunit domain protein [Mycobacterium xenopi 3993]|nr:putative cobaltochelatase CobN subunit domain protein [Mycobacterium xenopi 3993]